MKDRPTMKQLSEVMRSEHISIATKWYELGLELVDSNRILKEIRTDNRNDVNTCCHSMLERWLEKTPDASWRQLITALNNIGMNTAAEVIGRMFKPG